MGWSRSIVWTLAGVAAYFYATAGVFGQSLPLADAPKTGQNLSTSLRVLTPLVREDPHRAVRMLDRLEKEYPGHSTILNLLGETYQVMGHVDSAMAVYDRCLAANPGDIRAGASLGTLHIQKGDRERGEAVFRDLIAQNRRSVNAYRTIGLALSQRGFYDLASRLLEEGRRDNKANYILTLDLAQLHSATGDFEGALREYLYLIEVSPRHHLVAREKILELIRDPRADVEVLLGDLEAAAGRPPHSDTITNILALAYLEKGMMERALEVALEAETTGVSRGKVLFNLAERTVAECRRQPYEARVKYFDMALRALDAFIDGHPRSPEIPRAKFMLVDLLVDLASGRVERRPDLALDSATAKAIEALDWMIASFPGTDHAEEAYLKKGDVVFRIEKRPQEAIEIYREGLSKARFRTVAFAERLGRLYLVVGDYESAGGYFARLVNDKEPELHETGVYYTGLLLGINGQYEAARDTLTALAQGNPSSRFTNDAIGLAWAIEEGLQGDQRVLNLYARALRCEVAEDTTGAIEALKDVVEQPAGNALRARALLRIGELYQGAGMFDQAVEAFEGFIRDYPSDTRVPDAHRRIGQVYEYGYGDVKLALEKYESILLSYPYYIFLDEVREDVTRLRNKVGTRDGSS